MIVGEIHNSPLPVSHPYREGKRNAHMLRVVKITCRRNYIYSSVSCLEQGLAHNTLLINVSSLGID